MIKIRAAICALLMVVCSAAAAKDLTPPLQQPSGPAFAERPLLEQTGPRAYRLEVTLSEILDHHIFSLTNTDRLVVDFPELFWRVTSGELSELNGGDVGSVRVGLFRAGRSRMVIDLAAPARIVRSETGKRPNGGAYYLLEFEMDNPLNQVEVGAVPAAVRVLARGSGYTAPRPRIKPRPFTVVLDAGHGGRDPGAAHAGVLEKDLTLTFVKELTDVLHQPGLIHVELVRSSDVFVSLSDRVRRAHDLKADLFLSIHADAIDNKDVSGASVYTLSEEASDDLAARLARRENAADGFMDLPVQTQEGSVRKVFLDMAKSSTNAGSDKIAGLLVEALRDRVPVLPNRPHRRAGFHVLKTFDTPAVLIELGFLTNVRDRRRLTNPAWRRQAAQSVSSAVRVFVSSEHR